MGTSEDNIYHTALNKGYERAAEKGYGGIFAEQYAEAFADSYIKGFVRGCVEACTEVCAEKHKNLIESWISGIQNISRRFSITVEEAMDIMAIPEDERPALREIL